MSKQISKEHAQRVIDHLSEMFGPIPPDATHFEIDLEPEWIVFKRNGSLPAGEVMSMDEVAPE